MRKNSGEKGRPGTVKVIEVNEGGSAPGYEWLHAEVGNQWKFHCHILSSLCVKVGILAKFHM